MSTNDNTSQLLHLVHRAVDAFCLSTTLAKRKSLDEAEKAHQNLATELQNLRNDMSNMDPAVILQRLSTLEEALEELGEAAAGLGNPEEGIETPLHNIATALRKHYGIKERPEDIERLQESYKKYCDPFFDWERASRDRRAVRDPSTLLPSPCSVTQERQRQADDDLTQALEREPPLSPYRLGDPYFFPSSPYDRGDAMEIEGQETAQVSTNMSGLDLNRT